MTAYSDVDDELRRQRAKWGYQRHGPTRWFLILMEEVGEVADAIIADDTDNLREELIQVAAVAVQWAAFLDDVKAGKAVADSDWMGLHEQFVKIVLSASELGAQAKQNLETT